MNKEEYKKLVKSWQTKEPKLKNAVTSFLVGGGIGILGQVVSKLLMICFGISQVISYSIVCLLLIFLASLFTGIGFFDDWVCKVKCGLIIPTTGFAHSMTSCALEIKMQEVSIQNLLNNERLSENKIDYVFATDLINQLGVSSQTMSNFNIPFVGVYAACAGFPLQILLGSNLIESKNAKNIITLASSHNLTAERQFRYPTEYGCPKKGTATCTLTACVSMLLTNEKTNIKVSGGLIGKVVNLGINDVNNMGAVMAPACADTIYTYLQNAHETVKDYDLILTGDLGKVGLNILKEYYEKVYNERLNRIMDAGDEIFLETSQYSGGSGPVCLPLVFLTKILKNKKYKKILIVGSGSLHNPTLVNQGKEIPAISHLVKIEVLL